MHFYELPVALCWLRKGKKIALLVAMLVLPKASERLSVKEGKKPAFSHGQKMERVGIPAGLALYSAPLLSLPLLPISYSFRLAEPECSLPC